MRYSLETGFCERLYNRSMASFLNEDLDWHLQFEVLRGGFIEDISIYICTKLHIQYTMLIIDV